MNDAIINITVTLFGGTSEAFNERMMRFAHMVAADEREECAKLCDARHVRSNNLHAESLDPCDGMAAYEASMCAESIRGRAE